MNDDVDIVIIIGLLGIAGFMKRSEVLGGHGDSFLVRIVKRKRLKKTRAKR